MSNVAKHPRLPVGPRHQVTLNLGKLDKQRFWENVRYDIGCNDVRDSLEATIPRARLLLPKGKVRVYYADTLARTVARNFMQTRNVKGHLPETFGAVLAQMIHNQVNGNCGPLSLERTNAFPCNDKLVWLYWYGDQAKWGFGLNYSLEKEIASGCRVFLYHKQV